MIRKEIKFELKASKLFKAEKFSKFRTYSEAYQKQIFYRVRNLKKV